jgi:hypothetical protein
VPVDLLAEYVVSWRPLLDGGESIHREGDKTRPVRMRHPVKDRFVNCDDIPIYVAADGPRARQVAGKTVEYVQMAIVALLALGSAALPRFTKADADAPLIEG